MNKESRDSFPVQDGFLHRWKLNRRIKKELRKFPLHSATLKSLVFKIAESDDEIREALKLISDFQETNERRPHFEKLFLNTKGYALPGTTLFVAISNSTVIATSALIPDSAFGLPSDNITDIQGLRRHGRLIAEMTPLVVREAYYPKRFELMAPMMKLIFLTAKTREALDALLVIPSQEMNPFFEVLAGFSPPLTHADSKISSPLPTWISLTYNFDSHREKKIQSHKKSESLRQRLFSYFFEIPLQGVLVPAPSPTLERQTAQKGMSKVELMRLFPHLLAEWGPKDFQVIANLDLYKIFHTQTKSPAEGLKVQVSGMKDRNSPRAEVRLKAWAFFPTEPQWRDSLIIDLSEQGFQLKTSVGDRSIQIKDEFILVFEVNEVLIHLESKVMWVRNDTRLGCELKDPNPKWQDLVHEIYRSIGPLLTA